MARPLISLAGNKYGRLVVLKHVANQGRRVRYLCQCSCGVKKIIDARHIVGGQLSCGCLGGRHTVFDWTGKRFGRLIVVERVLINNRTHWKCQCDCGCFKVVPSGSLRSGLTKSCGCLASENSAKVGKSRRIHGWYGTSEWKTWDGMKQRCFNPNTSNYNRYGGRGITVCERWLHNVDNFIKDMGRRPSKNHSLDRIDIDGPYSPENCRWATWDEQNNNHSKNHIVEHNGERLTMSQWAKRLGLNYQQLTYHVRKGQTIQRIIEIFGV